MPWYLTLIYVRISPTRFECYGMEFQCYIMIFQWYARLSKCYAMMYIVKYMPKSTLWTLLSNTLPRNALMLPKWYDMINVVKYVPKLTILTLLSNVLSSNALILTFFFVQGFIWNKLFNWIRKEELKNVCIKQ